MRSGRFPEPTPRGTTFEADLEIIWPKEGLFGKEIDAEIPGVDIAGEDCAEMVKELSYGTYSIPQMMTVGSQLHERILNADVFILILNAAKITINGVTIEEEVGDDISDYPDTNLKHIVERVYDYKKEANANPIRAIAVVLTQYDKVSGLLQSQNINLLTEEGRHHFMSMYFPETYDMLNFIGLEHVKIIPSWVNTVSDPVTKMPVYHPKPFKDGAQSPLIKIIKGERMNHGRVERFIEPDYNRAGVLELIDWIKELAKASK